MGTERDFMPVWWRVKTGRKGILNEARGLEQELLGSECKRRRVGQSKQFELNG